MALRLQMKLGVVAESDRLSDSADTVVVVEPSVGSVARSKGHLYLLVTSSIPGNRAREATRLAAATVRNEYYYDESAGIRVCIEKAVDQANKRLAHVRDRFALGRAGEVAGPIGIGVAVVRGNELYVATIGPAEAYLIRGARLSTLPDPNRERGLPGADPKLEVWRGEISVGDSVVLVSPNVMSRLGPEDLKDAMVTLHPQSAMEHLHHRFAAADGHGSDGAIAFEATEVASTHRSRTLVPVRPAEPLAGAPDRGPIPLADDVAGGVAAVSEGARLARVAAGGAIARSIARLQDLLPQRQTAYRRVTPASARRDTQQRAAVAVLALIIVAGGLGLAIAVFRPGGATPQVIGSVNAGQSALDAARSDIARVFTPGVSLIDNDPGQARTLLSDAYRKLAAAEAAGIPAGAVAADLARVVAGLDSLFHVVNVADQTLFTFGKTTPPVNLTALVRGPDGAPYVLDSGTKSVYRIDLKRKAATLVLRAGTRSSSGAAVAAEPRLIVSGGPDLLILDAKNVLWRWRPSNDAGRGTLVRIPVNGATAWGTDVRAIATYLRNANSGLYNLYVVDPSAQQILAYSPQADGGGFTVAPSNWLSAARSVDSMRSLYIDGDLFVVENGKIERFVSGGSGGWPADPTTMDPGDEVLRPPPSYALVTSGSDRRTGRLYGYDPPNRRIVALNKADGRYVEQYRLTPDPAPLADLRGMYAVTGTGGGPDTIFWISSGALHEIALQAVVPPAASAAPSARPGSSHGPSAAPVKPSPSR